MKHLLLYLLLMGAAHASPLWIERGSPVPVGLVRLGPHIATGSMAPSLRGGEFYWGEPYTGQEIRLGDWLILVRPSDGKLVIHEATALNKRAVYTSGIANRYSDGWSPRGNIKFIVRFIERRPVSPSYQVR